MIRLPEWVNPIRPWDGRSLWRLLRFMVLGAVIGIVLWGAANWIVYGCDRYVDELLDDGFYEAAGDLVGDLKDPLTLLEQTGLFEILGDYDSFYEDFMEDDRQIVPLYDRFMVFGVLGCVVAIICYLVGRFRGCACRRSSEG